MNAKSADSEPTGDSAAPTDAHLQAADLATARGWLAAAARIAVLTGAGVSAESGVPTFRDAQTGWWAQFDPTQLATEAAFRANPERVWNWYAFRRTLLQKAAPNAAHQAIARFQQRSPGRLTLITQNVDGLHAAAGSTGVLALHGDLLQDRWLDVPRPCCAALSWTTDAPPRCTGCGNARRPAVVWFGEMLPEAALAQAQLAASSCEVMLVVGTSGAVHPAAGLAGMARAGGARVVLVNTAASDLDDDAHLILRGPAGQLLPSLLDD